MYKWELRQIDAWADMEGDWTWNESFKIRELEIEDGSEKSFLMDQVMDKYKSRFAVVYDGSIYELVRVEGSCPILALIPID